MEYMGKFTVIHTDLCFNISFDFNSILPLSQDLYIFKGLSITYMKQFEIKANIKKKDITRFFWFTV